MHYKVFDIQRRVVAHKTVESWETIPHVGIIIDLDVGKIQGFINRMRNHPDFADVRLTMNSVMLKIIAEAMKASEDMNTHIEYSRTDRVGLLHMLDTIDIAIPLLAHDRRLITPVLRDVGGKSLPDVCRAMETLRERSKNTNIDLLLYEAGLDDTLKCLRKGQVFTMIKRLWANLAGPHRIKLPSKKERKAYFARPATERLVAQDLLDASIVVSNVGSVMPELRCHVSILEIIAPAVSVIALAGVHKEPRVETDENGVDRVVIREIMPLTFCFDHRALDFADLTDFLERLLELAAEPEKLLL